jgi:endonuclease YncB( thermonuclease family)
MRNILRQDKLFLLLFTAISFSLSTALAADITGKVVAVTDGDTIKVLDADNTQYILLRTGFDSPLLRYSYCSAST